MGVRHLWGSAWVKERGERQVSGMLAMGGLKGDVYFTLSACESLAAVAAGQLDVVTSGIQGPRLSSSRLCPNLMAVLIDVLTNPSQESRTPVTSV